MSDPLPVRAGWTRRAGALVAGLVTVVSTLAVFAVPSSAAPTQSTDDPYPETAWEKYDGDKVDHWSEGGGTGASEADKAAGWQALWVQGCMARVGIRRVTVTWADDRDDNAYRIRVQVKCSADVEDAQERELADAPAVQISCRGMFGSGQGQASDWTMERTTRLARNLDAKFRKTFPNNDNQRVHGACTFKWEGRGEDKSVDSPPLGGEDEERRKVTTPGDGPWEDVDWEDPTKWSTEGEDAEYGWHDVGHGCEGRSGITRVTAASLSGTDRRNWYRMRVQVRCKDYDGGEGKIQIACVTAPTGSNEGSRRWAMDQREVAASTLQGQRDGDRAVPTKYRLSFLNDQELAVRNACTFTWQGESGGDEVTVDSPTLGGDASRRTGSQQAGS